MSTPMSIGASLGRRAIHFAVLALLGWALPAGAATLTPSFVDRTILADSFAATGPQFSSQTNGDGGIGGEPFDQTINAAAPTSGATAHGNASQSSVIDGFSTRGDGSVAAHTAIMEGADDPFAGGLGESIFLLEFSVDMETVIRISGLVEASAIPDGGDTYAVVELIDLGDGGVVFSTQATDGESNPVDEVVTLLPGMSYELYATAFAVTELSDPGEEMVSASFDFQMQVVPEPGTALLLAGGLALMSVMRRSRRVDARLLDRPH